jgi:hypothetical protein
VDECIFCERKYIPTQEVSFELESEDIDIELKICERCIEKFFESESVKQTN